MKTKLSLFLLLVPFYLFSQTTNNLEAKTISGFVTHDSKALENVTVFVENTTRFTVSDAKGFYSIKAKVGETISFSYVGLEKIFVLIEDVTSILNINMEIKKRITNLRFDKVLKLGESNIGENAASLVAVKIEGNSLNKNATSLVRAIQEKIPYIFIRYNSYGEEIAYIKGKELDGPIPWEIDNVVFDIPYPIYISEVKDVLVFNNDKKSLIRVNTNINYDKIKGINYDNYYFFDKDYYSKDAIPFEEINTKQPFLDKYKTTTNSTEALKLYLDTYTNDKNTTNYHLGLFNYFKKESYSKTLLLKVLSDYEEMSANNPEDLKAIAYKYQELNENQKALDVYKKIIKLRPKYRQSYRDLANTFLEMQKYRNVWLTYNYFFNKDFKIEDNDIGEIISSEIISTYNLDTDDESNRQKIKINNPTKNIESDIRLVFEWNTSEAEFIIEFVNPDLEVYKIENSAISNQGLIIDQKKKGYTSKEIFIDKLARGNYLVNLTYLGNKQYKPTVFKITTYYNWGRENQTKNIEVFDFTKKNIKTQLLKLNRKRL